MCGSGSLLLEAAMMAVDFAPGLMRILNGVPGHQVPPLLRWKQNKQLLSAWKDLLVEAKQRVKEGISWTTTQQKIDLLGNDLHPGALDLVDASLSTPGGRLLQPIIELDENDCQDLDIESFSSDDRKQQVWVMTNPPWGVRLSDDDHESWESLRVFLRSICPPGRTQAWVLSGNKSATKHLGLRRSQSIPIRTGQQDLRWIQYIMLDKSRREAAQASPSKRSPRQPQRAERDPNQTPRDKHTTPPSDAAVRQDGQGRILRVRSRAPNSDNGAQNETSNERQRSQASRENDSWS